MNPKWLPNTSYNIYPMMHLGVDLPAYLPAYWGVGVDLLADMPKSALTTIILIKPGKYEPHS